MSGRQPEAEPEPEREREPVIARALLLGAGAVLLGAGLLYNEWLLAPLARGAFRPHTLSALRHVELGFLASGCALLAASEAARRVPALARRLQGVFATTALLGLAGLLPVVIVDLGLRPFVDAKTAIFRPDPDLGWRLVPGSRGIWGGVPIAINADGLRGPRVPLDRAPGVARLLFLGDSVTFGFGIEATEAVFPSRVGEALGRAIGRPVEIVNAGVGGYSPWQEHAWLTCCGSDYAPDAIVLGFVLNDVTEPLSLVRYGGTGSGWQLGRTARGTLDRWLSGSAIATLLREGAAVLRFGPDVRLGAQQAENRDVERLVSNPARFERAWQIALADVGRIADVAEERGIPVLLVVFPYAFQLDAPPSLQDPQRRLARFASERGLARLDLLPVLRDVGADAFLDPSHLSVAGHAIVADAITSRVREEGWLSGGIPE